MSVDDWTLYARDEVTFERVAEIDDYRAFEMVSRFNAVGTWRIDIPASALAASYLSHTHVHGGEEVWHPNGLVAVRLDGTTFSGPITDVERRWDASSDMLTIQGLTDDVWLARRLAYPEAPALTTATNAYDVRTGTASTVMRAFVENNAGPSANVDRRVAGLTCAADPGLGSSVTGRGRFQLLDELLRELALSGGDLGFRVVQVDGGIEYQTYSPTDRSTTALFGEEFGNLRAFTYSQRCSEANFVVVGGGGEGVARTFVSGGDAAQIDEHGRIETFRDGRDTTDATELAQRREETLDEQGLRTSLSITPVDTEALAFGAGYGLGDTVTVVIDDETIRDEVREVRVVLSPDGETVIPVVGSPGERDPRVPLLFRRLSEVRSRISDLERRR